MLELTMLERHALSEVIVTLRVAALCRGWRQVSRSRRGTHLSLCASMEEEYGSIRSASGTSEHYVGALFRVCYYPSDG